MERRLSAILVADMVGYSRLMEQDEADTLVRQKAHRSELIDPALATHHGRVVKSTGDGLLAEFPSVVESVACAVEVQRAMVKREVNRPQDKRIAYRIGIHLGDVFHEDGDIHGDGVNVAARLEALANPGGICLSGDAYNQLLGVQDVGFEDLSDVQVKNISRPIRAWRVLLDPEQAGKRTAAPRQSRKAWPFVAVAAVIAFGIGIFWWMTRPDFAPVDPADMAVPLPREPSIAVLPFDYLGPDMETHGYIADGLSENIISTLASIPGSVVIARNSTFTYKGKPADVREVAKKFGVRYILEGSVLKSGDRVRVTAQLVDGVDGRNLWTEVYDQPISDIFAVLDEITLRTAEALYTKTFSGSDLRASGRTNNLQAWSETIQGVQKLSLALPEQVLQSIPHFERAIEHDPNYALAYASLAHTEFFKARFSLTENPVAALENAADLANEALSLDPENPNAFSALGMTRLVQRRADDAARAVIRGAELAPGSAFAHASAAWVLTFVGRAQDALPYFDRAFRMYVVPPWWLFGTHSQALSDLGRHEDALQSLKTASKYVPDGLSSQWIFSAAAEHFAMGDKEKANELISQGLALHPNYSIQSGRIWDSTYIDQSLPERRYQRLRELGIPETPPDDG